MSECVNAQELFCHLQDCVLYKPQDDEWQSFKSAITCWVDCWFNGAVPEFIEGSYLQVTVPGITPEPFITIEYVEDDAYPLHIKVYDEETGEMDGDSYNMKLYAA